MKAGGFHSAQQVHDEMERREKLKTTAGMIVPELMPGRGDLTTPLSGITMRAEAGNLAATLGAVSSVAPTIQQTSIKNLEPLFKKFTDAEVSVYAMDEQPIGPRIDVADVPEPTLKAIASFEVQRRGRVSDRKWHIVATGLVALVTGVVAWILRGVLGG